MLVERYPTLGGVCLNVGCIPSKALLHVARVIAESEEAATQGIRFGEPEIDLDGVRAFKDGAVGRLTGGLAGMAKQRKVRVVEGTGRFTGPHTLEVGDESITFKHCIIAAGSYAVALPGFPDDPRIIDSTGALELADVPERLLVVGGGIIGLEMATVYDALGSRVTVVELLDQLIPGADPDVVKPLHKRISGRYEAIHLKTGVEEVRATDDGLVARFGDGEETFDRILVAVGRRPNGGQLGADAAGVEVDERGFIPVDEQMRTNVAHIYAIGDIVGEPMLAHKATHEAKVAAENIAGHNVAFDAAGHPQRGLHGPGGRLDGPHRDEREGAGHRGRDGRLPVGRVGTRARDGPIRRPDEAHLRARPGPPARRRDGGRQRRRADRRDGPCARDGRRRGGHRAHRPPAPDAVGVRGHGGRGRGRDDHRSATAAAGAALTR